MWRLFTLDRVGRASGRDIPHWEDYTTLIFGVVYLLPPTELCAMREALVVLVLYRKPNSRYYATHYTVP